MAAEAAGARAGGGKGAVLWAAFFNFIAFGTKVADTVGQTVKPGFASVAVIFAASWGRSCGTT
jgi:phosphate/sulfate permease